MLLSIIYIVAAFSVLKILDDPAFEMTPAQFWFSDLGLFLDNQSVSKEYWWIYAVIYIAYIVLLSLVLMMQTAQGRERFVAEALKRNAVDYELIVKHGRQLHEHVSKKKPAVTGPGTDFSKIQHFAPLEQSGKSLNTAKKRAWWQIWTPRGS